MGDEIKEMLERRVIILAKVAGDEQVRANDNLRLIYDMLLDQYAQNTARVLGEADVDKWLASLGVRQQ